MSRPLPVLDGRRFGCTRCGNCCLEPGYVFFTWPELDAMATHLGIGVATFKARFGVKWDSAGARWEIDATDGRGCPLLNEARECSVHPVKPTQCRTFPFWPELLDEEQAWEGTKRYCPGLDAPQGQLYSAAEIRRIRDEADL